MESDSDIEDLIYVIDENKNKKVNIVRTRQFYGDTLNIFKLSVTNCRRDLLQNNVNLVSIWPPFIEFLFFNTVIDMLQGEKEPTYSVNIYVYEHEVLNIDGNYMTCSEFKSAFYSYGKYLCAKYRDVFSFNYIIDQVLPYEGVPAIYDIHYRYTTKNIFDRLLTISRDHNSNNFIVVLKINYRF